MPQVETQADRERPVHPRKGKNDLAWWFPILASTGVKVPKTVIVQAPGSVVEVAYGEPCPALAPLVASLREAAETFGYPVFLRTGYGSGKHSWDKTCCVRSAKAMTRHVAELIEWSECVDMIGVPTDTWAVREMLLLVSSFEAFYGKMPVNKERRYFFSKGEVVCHHPYWPEEAIKQPSDERWWEKLAELNLETEEEIAYLSALTRSVAKAFDGAWSLDWALAKDGNWYAIDMATANTSWHWSTCPNRTFD